MQTESRIRANRRHHPVTNATTIKDQSRSEIKIRVFKRAESSIRVVESDEEELANGNAC